MDNGSTLIAKALGTAKGRCVFSQLYSGLGLFVCHAVPRRLSCLPTPASLSLSLSSGS